jgi:hypothetical protein
MKKKESEKDFEGKLWLWNNIVYAPVNMRHGTVQGCSMRLNARDAWKAFEYNTQMKQKRLEELGYRVKKINITPGWKLKNEK